ncbi:MAG: bifunctional nuclease family protein [bacterium]|nr:bifunctional nuclease family protein [bacterium]
MIPVVVETLVVGGPNESKIILRPIVDTGPNPRVLSVYIDMGEALALSMAAQTKSPKQIYEEDLSLRIMEQLGADFSRSVIYGIEKDRYLARVVLRRGTEEIKVEAKASDAITMSIKAKAPIYVSPEVMAAAGAPLSADKKANEEREALDFHNFVEGLNPDDFVSEAELDDLRNADNLDDLLGGGQ